MIKLFENYENYYSKNRKNVYLCELRNDFLNNNLKLLET